MELIIILLLCLANGLFSATELAMVSARRGRLQQRAEAGEASAELALTFQDDPNRLLSTVQVGITLIGTLAGVFGGANLAEQLRLILSPLLGTFAESVSLFLVVAVIAYLQLVIGELVPKRLALQSAESIAIGMARPMAIIAALSRPIIALLTGSTELLLALLGRRNTEAERLTEDDIRQIVREGVEEGAIEPQEHQIIDRVIRLGDRSVRQVMTPRHSMSAANAESRLGDVIDELLTIGFSRFPIYEQHADNIIGVAHVRDLLRIYRTDPGRLVRDAIRTAMFVPEASNAAELLPLFRKTQQHMAIVVSELGTVEGLITLEDVLEEIVGEIADEYDDREEELIIRRDDGSFLIAGLAPIEQVEQLLELENQLQDERYRYETLAGFILSQLGRIPRSADHIDHLGWRFEVVDMDGLRIDKILVSTAPATASKVPAE